MTTNKPIQTYKTTETPVTDNAQSLMAVVDGGGTGTRLRLVTSHGEIVSQAESGPSSLALGIEHAQRNISAALKHARDTADSRWTDRPISRLALGLAGSRAQPLREEFARGMLKVLNTHNKQQSADILISSDTYTSALGALQGNAGLMIAIGTGVAACWLSQDAQGQHCIRFVSGWGFKGGDEGGGAWLGQCAVQAYLQHFDGRVKQASCLYDAVAAVIGQNHSDIQIWLREAQATAFASLAPVVIEAANRDDALAQELLQAAAEHIRQAIQALDDKHQNAQSAQSTDLPIAMLGGLHHVIAPRLPEAMQARLIQPKGNSLDGALGIALGDYQPERY